MRPSGIRPSLPLPTRLKADMSATGSGIGIAMIDSDFVEHPDLAQPVQRIRCYYNAVDDVIEPTPTGRPEARQWHGTMTACTAAGNGYLSQGEFISLAPDAHVVLVRTMNEEGRITTEVISRALQWVSDNAEEYGIRVVNLSVYADEFDHTIDHPVNKLVDDMVAAGLVIVAAAGNNPHVLIRPPAAAPAAITVGGLDDKNSLNEGSADLYHSTFGLTSLGIQKPEVIAPAIWLPAPIMPHTAIQRSASALCALDAMTDDMLLGCAPRLLPFTHIPLSVWTSRDVDELRDRIAEALRSEQIVTPFYKMVDGTSFASPIVVSVVAQMLELDPTLTPQHVKSILMRTARPLPNHPLARQGAGVVQQREALRVVRDERPSREAVVPLSSQYSM
ncbi:MAG: S8 family serine peptidase [bacterium]|nr:S8 family serine peptidase [bacterium]